jgi:hypothetical protein
MTVKYSATFEFEVQAPITHRGTVVASSMPTCFARAAREAVKAYPGLRWSSMVIVLLERVADAGDTETDDASEPQAAGEALDAHASTG